MTVKLSVESRETVIVKPLLPSNLASLVSDTFLLEFSFQSSVKSP